MVFVRMDYTTDEYMYHISSSLHPKDWKVEVKDTERGPHLFATADVVEKTHGGEDRTTKVEWHTKLSRQVNPSSEPTVRARCLVHFKKQHVHVPCPPHADSPVLAHSWSRGPTSKATKKATTRVAPSRLSSRASSRKRFDDDDDVFGVSETDREQWVLGCSACEGGHGTGSSCENFWTFRRTTRPPRRNGRSQIRARSGSWVGGTRVDCVCALSLSHAGGVDAGTLNARSALTHE